MPPSPRPPQAATPAAAATALQRRQVCSALALGAALALALLLITAAPVSRAAGARHPGAVADEPAQEPGGHGLPFHVLQRPGYLGVSLRDLDAAEATRLHRRGAMGAMIITVDRDAPAWGAGLRPQDVVLELNGLPIDGVEALRRRLREFSPGETITLRVRRGDEEMSYAVTLGDQEKVAQTALSKHLRAANSPQPGSEPAPDSLAFASNAAPAPAPPAAHASRGMASTLFDALIPGSIYTGLEVAPLTPQLAAFFGARPDTGLLVTAINDGSPAATAGLIAGDVILRASNRAVKTRSSLAQALRAAKGNAVPLAVLRDHKELILSLVPEKRKKL